MKVFIYRNNQQLGPFDPLTINQYLQKGQLSPNDLACFEGGTNWQPLKTLGVINSFGMINQANLIMPQNHLHQSVKVKQGSVVGGCAFACIGVFGCAIGGGLSVTGLGAIIGIPMIIIFIPMALYGGVLFGRAFRRR